MVEWFFTQFGDRCSSYAVCLSIIVLVRSLSFCFWNRSDLDVRHSSLLVSWNIVTQLINTSPILFTGSSSNNSNNICCLLRPTQPGHPKVGEWQCLGSTDGLCLIVCDVDWSLVAGDWVRCVVAIDITGYLVVLHWTCYSAKAELCYHCCLSVCLSVCLFVRLSVSLSVCQSLCLSVCLLVRLSVILSVCQSLCLSVCLFVRLSVILSVCLFVCLSVRPFVCEQDNSRLHLQMSTK